MKQNSMIITGIIFLAIGVLLGWLIWGRTPMMGMHRMPNGSMMSNRSGMDHMMDGMMQELEGKTGDEFDKAFLSEMIVHHEGAVEMARAVIATSKRPELIKLANDIIAAQMGEIDTMKKWQQEWFK